MTKHQISHRLAAAIHRAAASVADQDGHPTLCHRIREIAELQAAKEREERAEVQAPPVDITVVADAARTIH
jgi:hypothetical protein